MNTQMQNITYLGEIQRVSKISFHKGNLILTNLAEEIARIRGHAYVEPIPAPVARPTPLESVPSDAMAEMRHWFKQELDAMSRKMDQRIGELETRINLQDARMAHLLG